MEQLDLLTATGATCATPQQGSRDYILEMMQYMNRAIDRADNTQHYDKLIKSWNEDNSSEKRKK